MKAIAQTEAGSAAVLKDVEMARPVPKQQELLVRVYASGINPTCVKQREQAPPFTPFVIGRDAAGEVVEVGKECSKFKVGDHVYFSGDRRTNGTNAQYTVVAEYLCGRKPASLSWGEAAAMPLVTLTAWEAFFEQVGLTPGQQRSVLVTAGAGGVGSIAIQIAARVLGLTVVATASREETVQFCREMGAHHVVNHRKDLGEQLKEAGVPKVDIVMNCADWGNANLDAWAGILKPLGRIVSILPPTGSLEPGTMTKLFFLRAQLLLELMWTRTLSDAEPAKQGEILDAASKLFDVGTLRHTLRTQYDFIAEGLQKGHEFSEKGQAIGKICIVDRTAPS
eukprot:CAMPEP_0198543666 /NCGR_PEP_ID=MMETSP1462-20131121/59786_1 /TAXON_ID=1333877 /ORGANISM="Brandtodinium nutriculum, Strain RCC3387" /LENGTH=336 /DNA_ID=CAMNT_0044273955 /DNA_START=95 /DNA_END=1105 /DNA_ORIENTATION=+